MNDTLAATAKQTALELIDMSDTLADSMQTWGELLAESPESPTAQLSAGFINKPTADSAIEMVIDVQAPPEENAVLRTWAIKTETRDDGKEYFNNIQLTFEGDGQKINELVAKGVAITREDIRQLLQDQATQLARITVSDNTGGDGQGQTYGQRYDFTATELDQHPDDAVNVNQALQTVLQTLKQS